MNKNYDCNKGFIYCLRPNGRTVRFNIADMKTLNKFHRNLNLNEGIQKRQTVYVVIKRKEDEENHTNYYFSIEIVGL